MFKQIFVIIIIFLSIFIKSQSLENDFTWINQDYNSVKEVKIFKEGRLGVIQQFNEKGNPIFIKNIELNGDKIIAVWSYKYDGDKLVETIFGHSNIGFSISENKYSKNKTEIYGFKQKKDNSVVNSYPFIVEIKNINSIKDLEKLPSILNIKKSKKYLSESTEYNDNGGILKILNKNSKGKIETESHFSYSNNYEKIEFKTGNKNYDVTTEKYFDDNKKLIKEKYRDTEILYHYENNLLKNKETFESGKLTLNEKYDYNDNRQIIKTVTYVSDYNKSFTDSIEYNEKGKIKTETKERIEGVLKYNYEYKYW